MSISLPEWDLVLCIGSAVFMAVTMTVLFVYVRHEVRIERLKTLGQFEKTFDLKESKAPSFEYVREKYLEDISLEELEPDASVRAVWRDATPSIRGAADLEAYDLLPRLRRLKWYRLRSTRVLLASAMPYMVLTAAGLILLLACNGADPLRQIIGDMCRPMIISGGLHADDPKDAARYFENVLTVSGMAFLGAYIFTLGTLARGTAIFDLNAITMLRVTIHLITAVAGTIIIYRSVPDIAAMVGEVFGGDGSRAAGFGPLQPGWYVFAFFLGLTPDVVINLSTSLAQWVAGSRSPKGDAFHRTKSVPLDVIDGVDFFIRFRLQQANIFEVQNLAVANPIMMFVETPFGVYQCVDWVAQAQLCTVVGADRFVALRRYNIRTIFDLERALLSVHSTSQMRRFVVSLMLTTPANEGDAGRWKGRDLGRTTQAASPAFTIGSEAFGAYVARLFSEQPEDDKGVPRDDIDATLKHLGRIVVDDLHVHRLRQIWRQVASRLDGAYDRLPDTERVGDAP